MTGEVGNEDEMIRIKTITYVKECFNNYISLETMDMTNAEI